MVVVLPPPAVTVVVCGLGGGGRRRYAPPAVPPMHNKMQVMAPRYRLVWWQSSVVHVAALAAIVGRGCAFW